MQNLFTLNSKSVLNEVVKKQIKKENVVEKTTSFDLVGYIDKCVKFNVLNFKTFQFLRVNLIKKNNNNSY